MINLAELCKIKYRILKESCPKNVVLAKTKNNIFLQFLDKMRYSVILRLGTYDWFCADRSHLFLTFQNITIFFQSTCRGQE